MRASGYSEALGFTVHDTMIYKRHLEQLVREEVDVMMERVAGEMDTDEAADLLERAVEPMRDLVAALRAKLLVSELRARRAAQLLLSDLAIRAAEPRDHDDLFRIYAAVVEEGGAFPRKPPADELMFREGWFEGKIAVYVAEVDGAVAGSYHLQPNFEGTAAHIANAGYMVARAYRRHGVGRALVERWSTRGKGSGIRRHDVQPGARVQPEPSPVRGIRIPEGRSRPRGDRRRGRDRLLAQALTLDSTL